MNSHNNKQRTKKGVRLVLLIVGVLVLIEVIALFWLLRTVKSYDNFWEGKSQEQGEITYLALGDSAAQGIGATSPMRGYVGLIAKKIESKTGKTVKVVNISKTGATINDYLTEQAPLTENIEADVVTIEIGANDVKSFEPDKFRTEFRQVLNSLPDGAYVANMPLFNSRPSSTPKAKAASQIIEEELKQYPNLVFVDLQKQTTENQSIFGFAPDLFHPNNFSYKNWADAFWVKIEPHIK